MNCLLFMPSLYKNRGLFHCIFPRFKQTLSEYREVFEETRQKYSGVYKLIDKTAATRLDSIELGKKCLHGISAAQRRLTQRI